MDPWPSENREKLTELVGEIKAQGGKVSSINLRSDSEENVNAVIESVDEPERHGRES
jgi:hypothetical protein